MNASSIRSRKTYLTDVPDAPGCQRLIYTERYITWPAVYPDFRNRVAIAGKLAEREKLLLLPARKRHS